MVWWPLGHLSMGSTNYCHCEANVNKIGAWTWLKDSESMAITGTLWWLQCDVSSVHSFMHRTTFHDLQQFKTWKKFINDQHFFWHFQVQVFTLTPSQIWVTMSVWTIPQTLDGWSCMCAMMMTTFIVQISNRAIINWHAKNTMTLE